MSGLRERQKEMRREAIAAAAIELFHSQGFQATTIEHIATRAGVSAPTVFKYFGSKQEIILEVLKQADHRAMLDTRKDAPSLDNPVDLLCHIEKLIVGYTLEVLSPALWRELLPLVMGTGSDSFREAYRLINASLQRDISSVLSDMQRAGKLRADLDIDLAAFLFNDYSHLQLMRLTRTDTPDMEAHSLQVRGITELIFRGMQAEGATSAAEHLSQHKKA